MPWPPTNKKRKETFKEKLVRWRDEIQKDADGRTCGNCIFFTPGACIIKSSVFNGEPIFATAEAPACPSYLHVNR